MHTLIQITNKTADRWQTIIIYIIKISL